MRWGSCCGAWDKRVASKGMRQGGKLASTPDPDTKSGFGQSWEEDPYQGLVNSLCRACCWQGRGHPVSSAPSPILGLGFGAEDIAVPRGAGLSWKVILSI